MLAAVLAYVACGFQLHGAQQASPTGSASGEVKKIEIAQEAAGANAGTSATSSVGDQEYMLQKGDDLEIHAFNNNELNQKAKIRPDGKISLVLLDDVTAAGQTPTQLGRDLSQAYAQYFRNPRITVSVTSFTNLTVFVGGEVQTPKLLPLSGPLTVVGAVFSAGGLKPSAKTREVILLRDSGKGTPLISQVNLNRVFKNLAPDPQLKPFDVVYVPKSKIARVDQFVEQYMRQLLPITLGLGFSYLLGQQPLIQ